MSEIFTDCLAKPYVLLIKTCHPERSDTCAARSAGEGLRRIAAGFSPALPVQQVVHNIPNFYRENDNSNNVSFSNAFNIVPALFAVTRPLPSRRVSARGFCLTSKPIRDIGDDGRYFQR